MPEEIINIHVRKEFNIRVSSIDPSFKILFAKKGEDWEKRTESFNLSSLNKESLSEFIKNKINDGWKLYSKNPDIRVLIMQLKSKEG